MSTKAKVLVIDDEVLVRRSIARVFKINNYEVFEASDGLEGVKLWKSLSPDLIFLDVLMPGLNGPEVLEEMGLQRSGKVVLMSAYTGHHSLESAKNMNIDLFISKPFEDIFEVLKMVEEKLL